jgi:hypothetical protein
VAPGVKWVRPVSETGPSGNLLKIEFEILKLKLRTNMRDMFKMSPVTSSFDETPEASTHC